MSSPLSAFTAVPNPQMLAFMGTQSFIMMYQAGEGWQYGKRKQSAMSNEEFNKQTPLSIMDRQRTELINALPSIKDSMNAMTPLIKTIVEQYGDFINEAIKATKPAIDNATEGLNFPFPFAYGDTGKSSSNTTSDIATALLKWLTGGPVIKIVSDRNTYTPPTNQAQTDFENIPEDEDLSGAELTSAANDLAYRKAQEEKENAARHAALLASTKTVQTADALRRKSIADSGLSPLAFNARETFRKNIDVAVHVLKVRSADYQTLLNKPVSAGLAPRQLASAKLQLEAATKKLSALRIKYQQVYGEHY